MARGNQRRRNERRSDRHIDRCLWVPRMAVLHPLAGRSRTKFGPPARIGVWLSFVGRHETVHRVGHTIGSRWCGHGNRVLGMGEAAASFLESCGPLQRGPDSDAVCAWPRSIHPGDSRRLLGQGRPCARVFARRPLDHALFLDRDLLGLPRFLERMDSMLGSSCPCCAARVGCHTCPSEIA